MPRLANRETCTGCLACMNACAKGAISVVADEEGFLMPAVNDSKCVECHLCEQSCPEVQRHFHQNKREPVVYAGWNKTYRSVSSSGGAFSSIASYVLKKEGYVYGSTLDSALKCHHIEVNTMKDLEKLRGSKYVQSAIGETYQAVKKRLTAGSYVLFTGTPCQVSGLLSYLGKDYPKLITMDLICHGVPSQSLFASYIRKLKKRIGLADNEEITYYEFRRRDGWGFAPSISSNSNICRKLYGIDALYMSAFDNAVIFRRSCYQCHYAKTSRVGDFSIGDFWRIGHFGEPFKYDTTKGVSLLMVNSERGQAIMEELDESDFYVKRTLFEAVAGNYNLSMVSARNAKREVVIEAFMNPNNSLDDIEKQHHLLDRSLKKLFSNLSIKMGLYDSLKKIHQIITR